MYLLHHIAVRAGASVPGYILGLIGKMRYIKVWEFWASGIPCGPLNLHHQLLGGIFGMFGVLEAGSLVKLVKPERVSLRQNLA